MAFNKVKNISVKEYWRLLSQYFKPLWGKFLILAILLLGTIALQLVNPFILRNFIDSAKSGSDLNYLYNIAFIFISIAVGLQLLNVLVKYFGENVGWQATNSLRTNLTKHYLKLDMDQHKKFTTGEVIERIDGDVNALQNFFSQFIIKLVGNLLLIIGILGVLYKVDWRIGLGLTVFVFFALFAIERIRSYAVPYFRKVRHINGKFYGFLTEQLKGSEDIRANGGKHQSLKRFHKISSEWFPALKQAELRGYSMWMTTIAVFTIGNIFAFSIGAYLYNSGIITIGTVFMIFQFTGLMLNPIEQIRNEMEDLQRADASIERVKEMLSMKPKVLDTNNEMLTNGPIRVDFEDVMFSYDGSEKALENINFTLQPNKVMGLLGRSGSGKTTLSRILLRFYDPKRGKITLNGKDIRDIKVNNLRCKIGVVTQEVQLFQGTLRDNITFYNTGISDKELLNILDQLGLIPWYNSLPDGLNTMLMGDGISLSAGEAQLVAFARVFLMDPGLVILDEASARLDPATEKMLETAMSKLLRGRTGVIIAHRLESVKKADNIMVLEDGKILEYDMYDELAQDSSSAFYKLLKKGEKEILV